MNNKYHIEEYTSTHSLTHSHTTVLMPLPSYGFDPTESAIPWKYLTSNNYRVVIATPHGAVAHVDHRMYTGHDLGLLKPLLMADSNGTAAYTEFKNSHEFLHPISYDSIDTTRFDALLLPGGHDKGMREYLESRVLQVKVAEFFEAQKPVGAICHGVVLASRSTYKDTGVSVLWGRLTTCLTKSQELVAYNLTRCYLGDYYLTYPNTTVEDEVKSRLKDPEIHYNGGADLFIPLERDSPDSLQCGFAAVHGNYVSARWPGDAHLFSIRFLEVIYNRMEKIATDK
jgi:protease I